MAVTGYKIGNAVPTLYRHRLAIGGQAVVVAFALQIGTPPMRRRNLDRGLRAVPTPESDRIKLGIAVADWALMAGVASDNWFDCHVEILKRLRCGDCGPKTPSTRAFRPYLLRSRRY